MMVFNLNIGVVVVLFTLLISTTYGDRWVVPSASNMPSLRSYPSGMLTRNNSEFIIYGGQLSAAGTTQVTAYLFNTNSWEPRDPVVPLPGLYGHCIAHNEDSTIMYVFGGASKPGVRFNDLFSFNIETEEIIRYPTVGSGSGAVPANRSLCSLSYWNNKIYMYGGGQGTGNRFADFWEYDLTAQMWTQRSDLPYAGALGRLSCAYGTNLDSGLWFTHGGYISTTDSTNELLIFNHTADKWVGYRSIPRSTYDHSMTVGRDNTIYLWGGVIPGAAGTYFNTIGKYYYNNGSWSVDETPAGVAPQGRWGATMGIYNNNKQIIIFGGGNGDATANLYLINNDTYVPPTSTPTTATTSTTPTTSSSSVTPTSSMNTGDNNQSNNVNNKDDNTVVIAAAVSVAGAVLLAIVAAIVVVLLVRRNRRRRGSHDPQDVEGIPMDNSQGAYSHGSSHSGSRGNTSHGNTSRGGNSRGNINTSRGNTSRGQTSRGGGSNDDSNYAPIRVGNEPRSRTLGNSWEIPWDELEIDEELGRGAYGVVYKARWRNQLVAVKRVIGDFSQVQMEDFLAEAELMSKLRPHENVIQFLGVVTDPLAIITKFYENGSLSHYLESGEPLDLPAIVGLLKGIVAGVMHLHLEKIVHRDLACRNILVSGRGSSIRAVVSDFGFARSLNGTETGLTNSTIGPIRWMAPESLIDQQYSTKSDLFSFGVVVWEVVTRQRPWKELDEVNTILAVTQGKRLTIPDDTHPILRGIMEDCWRSADERPSFKEIYRRLDEIDGSF